MKSIPGLSNRVKTLAINKRARFDYAIEETYEAGIVLKGHEVKSVKSGHISLKESFVTIRGNELYLINAHISPYSEAGQLVAYDPTRARKLLLKKSEIKRLIGATRVAGLTLVPIRMYIRRSFIKLEFALGKGKKEYDKRHKIAKREDERRMRRAIRG